MIVGPGACLTFSREGYRFFDFNLKDVWDVITNWNFWAFAIRNPKLSIEELYRDLSMTSFIKSGQKMMPSLALCIFRYYRHHHHLLCV